MDWTIIFFPVYFIIACYFITKSSLFNLQPIYNRYKIVLFSIKVMAAIAYKLVHNNIYGQASDTVAYFSRSEYITKLLFTEPVSFFRLVFLPNGTNIPSNLAEHISYISVWHDSAAYFMTRVLSILNIFSGSNYFTNSIFFAFISFMGLTFIFRFFSYVFKERTKLLLAILFLTPSILFWCSGIHKEAISVFFIGSILFLFTLSKLPYLKRLLLIVLCCLGLGITREYVLILIVMSIIPFLLNQRKNIGILRYVQYYSIYLCIGLLLYFVSPNVNPFTYIHEMYERYQVYYQGKSFIYLYPLEPTVTSFIKAIPTAIKNVVWHPNISDATLWHRAISTIENYFILGFYLVAIVFNRIKILRFGNTILLGLFFAVSHTLLVGLTISNIGSLVRYRSISLIFLLAVFAIVLDTEKLKKYLPSSFNTKDAQ